MEARPDGAVVGHAEEPEEDLGRRAALRGRPAAATSSSSTWPRPASKPTRAGGSASTASTAPRQPHIFAVGDVIGFPSLASVSMEQGRLAAATPSASTVAFQSRHAIPYGIYTIPEISFIGKTEEQLTDDDVPYESGARVLPRDRARADPRRHDGPAEDDLPPRDQGAARRAHHRRRRRGAACTSARPCWRSAGRSTTSSTRCSTIRRWRSATRRRRSTVSTSSPVSAGC